MQPLKYKSKIVSNVIIILIKIAFLNNVSFGQDTDYTVDGPPTQTLINSSSIQIKRLTIGDKVPDIEFSMVNYSSETAKLSDFTNSGKLVILDFWATWCAPCLATFAKLDSLQNSFKENVQVILVNSKTTNDKESQIREIFKLRKNKNGEPLQLISAMGDDIASQLFPHAAIPHYVWITSDRTVVAITSGQSVNSDNILKVINKENLILPIKKDFEQNRLLQIEDNVTVDDVTHYSIFFKGKFDGIVTGNRLRKRNGILRGISMRNISLLDMYKTAINGLSSELRNNDKRIIINTKNISNLIFDSTKSKKEEWEKANLFTFDLILPVFETKTVYSQILQNLNQYSGFLGKIERRKVKCYILIRTSAYDKIKAKGGPAEFRFYSENPIRIRRARSIYITDLIAGLNKLSGINKPIIDGTKYNSKLDIDFPDNIDNVASLRQVLQQYDLDLIESERVLEMFVLNEKQY